MDKKKVVILISSVEGPPKNLSIIIKHSIKF